MKYDIALVVGRFQPYHNLHHKLIKQSLTLGERVVIVLGSAKSAPDIRNPFTPQMREDMIRSCFDEDTNKRLSFTGVRDYPYHENTWISEIQNIVHNTIEEYFPEVEDAVKHAYHKVALVGHDKDETSYYLKLFPQWSFEPFYENSPESRKINATDIRASFLSQPTYYSKVPDWFELVPESVKNFLIDFSGTGDYQNLVKEYTFIEEYKQNSKFVGLPFSPTFVTTDAVVTCKGHVLVVRRGANPGKGLLALPGGFLADGLTLKDNVIKELNEETKIKIHNTILKSLIKDSNVFDYPQRSQRGRTITHAFYLVLDSIKLEDGLPSVRGGDDADKAFWMPLAAIGENEDKFFEDHIHIIKHFVGVA